MTFITENKEFIVGALYALINIVNMITKHPAGSKSFLMWFIEMGSLLQSKDSPGWVKLPLKSVPPAPPLPPKVEEVHPPVGGQDGSP